MTTVMTSMSNDTTDNRRGYGSSISLRIWHPTVLGEVITNEIGLTPVLCNDVGTNRRTPNGEKLSGLYVQTYWLYEFCFPRTSTVEECLPKALETLIPHGEYLRRIASTGGRCELFIGVFLATNAGIELDSNLVRQVANAGLSLSLDLYLPDKSDGLPLGAVKLA